MAGVVRMFLVTITVGHITSWLNCFKSLKQETCIHIILYGACLYTLLAVIPDCAKHASNVIVCAHMLLIIRGVYCQYVFPWECCTLPITVGVHIQVGMHSCVASNPALVTSEDCEGKLCSFEKAHACT